MGIPIIAYSALCLYLIDIFHEYFSLALTGIDVILLGIILLLCFVVIYIARAKVRNEKLLIQSNQRLSVQNETKDKFFSILAHDLKSPFNTLLGFSELLVLQAESNKKDEVVKSSELIHRSTKKLYTLVDTLLQWSRTQMGTTEYKPEVLELDVEVKNIISILKISAQEKDIVLTCKSENHILAWADKDLFSAIMRNLLTNAIKFSAIGSTIRVELHKKRDEIIVSVIDSGIGMSKEAMESIFHIDRELNESKPGTLDERGTGLGLILCKEFVELNKGQIFVESELDRGTKIMFSVPLYHNN